MSYLIIAHHVPSHLVIAWLGFPLLPLPVLTLTLGLLGWWGLAGIIWLGWSFLLLLRLGLSLKVLPERGGLSGHVAESRRKIGTKRFHGGCCIWRQCLTTAVAQCREGDSAAGAEPIMVTLTSLAPETLNKD